MLFAVCWFKKNQLYFNNNKKSRIPSECQTIWIQIRPNFLLGLIWVQTVLRGYEQTTKGVISVEWVNEGVNTKTGGQTVKIISRLQKLSKVGNELLKEWILRQRVKLSAKTITRWQKLPQAGNDMVIEEVSIEMMLHLFNQDQGYKTFLMLNSMSMKVSN